MSATPNPASDDHAADTLPKLLVRNAERAPRETALREKEYGIWQAITWEQYRNRVRRFALGLVHLGLERGDRIAILGDNRPEWVIAELAAQAAGALPVGVYPDSVVAEVEYILATSAARFVVAEDQEQVDKILELRDRLPHLAHVIYHDPRGVRAYGDAGLLDFADVEAMGETHAREHPDAFARSVAATRADDVAVLGTTSGTTSQPKLAMLSHRNLLSMAQRLQQVDPMVRGDEFVSFLPLPWIGEQMVTMSWGLSVGFTVNFPEEPSTVQRDLREIGPQVIFSPPRIWENMVSDVQVRIEDAPPLKRRIFDWAMRVGEEAADARFERRDASRGLRWRRWLAEWLAFQPIKDQLGLQHLRHAYTGGAALGPDVFRFFHTLGVRLKQIYGQTEVSGISVLHRDDDVKFQTVGTPLPGTEVKVTEDGEILTRSPAVFTGYYENPEATAEALRDGWLHSGDAGYLDSDGHLVVIDRAKDVMTLQGGATFSPQFIENKLKFCPYIREAVVFGGERPFVTAIVAIDFANAGKWAEKRQIPYTTFTDLAQKREVYALIREHVMRANADLPEPARIRRFLLLHKELDADDAELTRTRKVRRGFVADRYEDLISALYLGEAAVSVDTTIKYQDGRTATLQTDLRIETLGHGGGGGG